MAMRRILRTVIDLTVMGSAAVVTHTAYGWPWGFAGIAVAAGYSMWCFFDGAKV